MYNLNMLSAKNQSAQIYNRSMGEQIIFYCEKGVCNSSHLSDNSSGMLLCLLLKIIAYL